MWPEADRRCQWLSEGRALSDMHHLTKATRDRHRDFWAFVGILAGVRVDFPESHLMVKALLAHIADKSAFCQDGR
jgi:hypothetical protein